jgi:flagellar protein FlaI
MSEKIDEYVIESEGTKAEVSIAKRKNDSVKNYSLSIPSISESTELYLEDIKNDLLKNITISKSDISDKDEFEALKKKLYKEAKLKIKEELPSVSSRDQKFVSSMIVQEMLGLGRLEFLLNDDLIEEICVNGSKKPVWVYHKNHGWLKTNIDIENESQIRAYASSIGRRVGRQITVNHPLLDAHLLAGDRVNATLSPLSIFGNTLTIRKFSRKPWTITDHIVNKTISYEAAAFMWLAIQYELNLVVAGGTAAGKTSFLNVLSSFFPPNQRVISIEQTREITLPSNLQWVPMLVRQSTSEGKGEVSMLDLMVNSLRMRPDRLLVGEIRRSEEASVLFEAMHTGHSVYSTLHAETASETMKRLVNKPIEIPPVVLESLHLIAVMYRDRRSGIRRLFELNEVLPMERKEKSTTKPLFRWKPSGDTIRKEETSVRCMDLIKRFSRMNDREISQDLKERESVLKWLVKKNIRDVDSVGEVISQYYTDQESLFKRILSRGRK